MSTAPSRSTLRRRVRDAGGYYSSQARAWVLPGALHNLTPWSVETVWCFSLEHAAELCDEHARQCAAVRAFGRGEEASR